jgi:hypothetical protein
MNAHWLDSRFQGYLNRSVKASSFGIKLQDQISDILDCRASRKRKHSDDSSEEGNASRQHGHWIRNSSSPHSTQHAIIGYLEVLFLFCTSISALGVTCKPGIALIAPKEFRQLLSSCLVDARVPGSPWRRSCPAVPS